MAGRARRVLVRTSASMGGQVSALVDQALDEAGVVPCECSDLVLAVNAPGAAAAPCTEQPHRDVETQDRALDVFVAALADDQARGRSIALADVAYVGGRESALEEALARAGLAPLVHESGAEPLAVVAAALAALTARDGAETP